MLISLIHWPIGWLGFCLSTGELQSTYSPNRFLESQYQLVYFQFFHLRYVIVTKMTTPIPPLRYVFFERSLLQEIQGE